jgi:hypothetical protein
MRTNLLIVEDFYADPAAVRKYALSRSYYHPYQPDDLIRRGTARPNWFASDFLDAGECPFKSSTALIERLEAITGERIDIDHWKRSFPVDSEGKAAERCAAVEHSCLWNCCFHVKPGVPQALGEGVHNHVTDTWNSVGPDGWAGIIYLSPDAPLEGGLKLWRNKRGGHDFDWMTPADNWTLIDDIGNVYNRLVLARGDLPHSGSAGWGDTVATGRLFQTFFFKTTGGGRRDSLSLLAP